MTHVSTLLTISTHITKFYICGANALMCVRARIEEIQDGAIDAVLLLMLVHFFRA